MDALARSDTNRARGVAARLPLGRRGSVTARIPGAQQARSVWRGPSLHGLPVCVLPRRHRRSRRIHTGALPGAATVYSIWPVAVPVRTPGLPTWTRSLWDRPTGALDAVCAFGRGTIADWLHRGFAGWGDYSRLISPGLDAGDLDLLRLYEEVYTDVGASALTVAPALVHDVPECLPGGQPCAMSDAGHHADPRRAAAHEFTFGATLRRDRNEDPQADWMSACIRRWPYDSLMRNVVSLLLGKRELDFMQRCGLAWDVGDPGEWLCARRFVPVHRGSCGVSCVACTTPLPVAGGAPCFPLSRDFFHVQGPLDGGLARLELLTLLYLASWSELVMDLTAAVDKDVLAFSDWAQAALRAHRSTRSALAQRIETDVDALFGPCGLTCA